MQDGTDTTPSDANTAPPAETPAQSAAPETSAAPAPETQHYPTPAEARAAEENDLLGNVPRGTSAPAPAPAVEQKAADTPPPAEKPADTPPTIPPATPPAAATPPATPVFDISKLAGGRFKTEADLTAALKEADDARTALANPQLQAMTAMLADPVKMSDFARVQAIDYVALAKTDPKAVLFDEFKATNPQYSAETVKIRFEQQYEQQYKYLEFADEEDPQYQQSVALRDEDARFAAERRATAQATQRAEMLAAIPAAPAPAAAPVVSDAEIAAHVAAVLAAPVPAHALTIGDQVVPVTVTPEVAAQVQEFATDVYGYFEKRGAIDERGNFDIAKLQAFGLQLANYDAAVQAAADQGAKTGFAAGVASVVNPGDSGTPPPNASNNNTQPVAAPQQSSYFQRQEAAAQAVDY